MHDAYISDRADCRVIDAETRQPVEGAVVVTIWRKVSAYAERWDGIFLFSETVTDSEGRFTIPRWGPRPGYFDAFLDRRDPEIWILKQGYLATYFDNAGSSEPFVSLPGDPDFVHFVKMPPYRMRDWSRGSYARPARGASVWNNRTLSLKRGRNDRERASTLAAANPLDPYLPITLYPIPRYWAEWNKSRDALDARIRPLVRFPPVSVVEFVETAHRRP